MRGGGGGGRLCWPRAGACARRVAVLQRRSQDVTLLARAGACARRVAVSKGRRDVAEKTGFAGGTVARHASRVAVSKGKANRFCWRHGGALRLSCRSLQRQSRRTSLCWRARVLAPVACSHPSRGDVAEEEVRAGGLLARAGAGARRAQFPEATSRVMGRSAAHSDRRLPPWQPARIPTHPTLDDGLWWICRLLCVPKGELSVRRGSNGRG